MTGRTALVFGLLEAASATAHRLNRGGWRMALAADAPPKVHRRKMSFADVWWDGSAVVSGAVCVRMAVEQLARQGCAMGIISFVALTTQASFDLQPWAVAVDALLAKRSTPMRLRGRAPLTIGYGPGHTAGETCDLAIETQWGERMGAVFQAGPTAALVGEPRAIEGVGRERIVYAPVGGALHVLRDIGDPVEVGETVARIGRHPIVAPIDGPLRGMMHDGLAVETSDKFLEVDPRLANLAIFTGIGQRPATIAETVARAVEMTRLRHAVVLPPSTTVPSFLKPISK